MSLINFESSTKLENQRNEKRKRREKIIDDAKEKYQKHVKRKEERRLKGEDTWMLPSVSQKIADDEQKIKSKKPKKEKKKHKKKQKHKKKEKNNSSSSDDSEDDDEMQWVVKEEEPKEAPVKPVYTVAGPPPSVLEPQQSQRDDWMKDSFDMNTYTRKDLRKDKDVEKEKEKKERKSVLDNPGQCKNELNPFWKNGGSGLPEENPNKTSTTNVPKKSRDGGVWWLKQSYKRAVEQSDDSGKAVDDILAERFGSAEKYYKMLAEAEGSLDQQRGNQQGHRNQNRDGRYDGRTDDRRDRYDDGRTRHRDRNDNRGRHENTERDKNEYKDEERSSRRSRDPHDDRRSGSDRRHERDRDDKREEKYDNRDRKSRFLKPGDMSSKRKPMFRKPGEGIGEESSYQRHKEITKTTPSQNWRDKAFRKPSDETEKAKDRKVPSPVASSSKESKREYSNSGSSSSSEDGSGSGSSDSEERSPSPPPVRILTEQEMNQLGAKILRAELMGNEEQAAKLKAELEAARKAKLEQPKMPARSGQSNDQSEEIILTRMNKSGQCWPVPEMEGVAEYRKGKTRKKKVKLPTHGDGGERERYFADDDNFDLKTLVQRERMSRAEDQNMMLSRLAGRSIDKTDDEYHTLDDMFVSRAAQVESRAQAEEKMKARAIAEHKQLSAALSKCPYCLDSSEMKKHLIISLGTKVYLSLPATRSLTDGHCLLIPMQHATAATALDEDVWNEIQTLKRALVTMFESQDEDVVFLETSMNLRKQYHMRIECVPVPKELEEMAPIYFKKAIMETGSEWSQNKKLIDTHQKGIRKSVPKGFPYFSVEFAMDGGFAHVIEDEQTFSHYFGKEILGGMLDLEPRRWRNPLRENFDNQRRKVLRFADWWKPFDITNK
ncbi:CWF19-like protein 2 [Antedon mediterranea]|uniref:CWF19-like protein 2 n=1 Tax=Antedon mediterranea TaxID=105859 RepID=UPI003AF9F022